MFPHDSQHSLCGRLGSRPRCAGAREPSDGPRLGTGTGRDRADITTTARGVWAMEDLLSLPDNLSQVLHGWGHYHETYERIGGQWRIKTLQLTRLRVDGQLGQCASRLGVRPVGPGCLELRCDCRGELRAHGGLQLGRRRAPGTRTPSGGYEASSGSRQKAQRPVLLGYLSNKDDDVDHR